MGLNKVFLIGRAGKDAELKALSIGTNLATFSLATDNHRFKDDDGKPRTEWHQIVAWGKLAEICDKYVTKGKLLYLEGRIQTRTWEHEGVKRYSTEIHIEQNRWRCSAAVRTVASHVSSETTTVEAVDTAVARPACLTTMTCRSHHPGSKRGPR